jgi:hypothetical protein
MIALAILCCVPIYALAIITVISPLAIDAAGAAYAGHYPALAREYAGQRRSRHEHIFNHENQRELRGYPDRLRLSAGRDERQYVHQRE